MSFLCVRSFPLWINSTRTFLTSCVLYLCFHFLKSSLWLTFYLNVNLIIISSDIRELGYRLSRQWFICGSSSWPISWGLMRCHNAQVAPPALREKTRRERGAGTTLNTLRPLYVLLPLTGISLMTQTPQLWSEKTCQCFGTPSTAPFKANQSAHNQYSPPLMSQWGETLSKKSIKESLLGLGPLPPKKKKSSNCLYFFNIFLWRTLGDEHTEAGSLHMRANTTLGKWQQRATLVSPHIADTLASKWAL